MADRSMGGSRAKGGAAGGILNECYWLRVAEARTI
jgi:hypothetical protein